MYFLVWSVVGIMDMRLACKCPGDDSGAEAGHQEGEAKPLNLVISSRLR